MMHISVEEAVKKMRKEFVDLTNDEFKTGVSRAINHTLAKAKTSASREIRTVYAISAKDVGQALTIRKAGKVELTGFVIAAGKPIPLKKFRPLQTDEGVSVIVKKGQRQLIKAAFLTTMPSGHTGVFARGSYKQGGYEFRHKRIKPAGGYRQVNGRWQPIVNDTPINTLTTTSVPLMFANDMVLNAVKKRIEEDFPARMLHELKRIRG